MDHLREYESDETLPKRRLPKSRKPYAVEMLNIFAWRMKKEWFVIRRYKTLEQAEQALKDLLKNTRKIDVPGYRLHTRSDGEMK